MPASPHVPERRVLSTQPITMRWGDMDALGHLNNAVYLTYFEQARTDWLLGVEGGREAWNGEMGPVMARVEFAYKRPIVFPATVLVDLWTEAPRRSSVVVHCRMRTAEAPDVVCAEGQTTLVWVRFATGRPTSLPALFQRLWDANTGADGEGASHGAGAVPA